MRGTNCFLPSLFFYSWGSPPLARDKYKRKGLKKSQQRITPACAGQMFSLLLLKFALRDHPRLRGTNSIMLRPEELLMGSPPLARDKSSATRQVLSSKGITPACAGQILLHTKTLVRIRDHPRLRGTNQFQVAQDVRMGGSPPLARDKLLDLPSCAGILRITPACAGQIRPSPLTCKFRRDHPRLRGTNIKPTPIQEPSVGSPPLARDKSPYS